MAITIKVLNLLVAAGVVAVMVFVWFTVLPSGAAASAYVTRQQAMIRSLNTPMPALGALAILLSLTSAYVWRDNRTAMSLFIVAGILFIGSGIITRFCNQPINAMVMTWTPAAPPANWESLRDQWQKWHVIRTLLGIIALSLLLVGHVQITRSSAQSGRVLSKTVVHA